MAALIRGFICAFDDRAVLKPGLKWERFARNAIINRRAPLRIAHDKRAGANYAWCDISQNQFGYRFEAVIPDRSNSYAVARMIREGTDAVSMCFRPIARRYNGTVAVIEKARLLEISIGVAQGMYPSARCWVVDPDLDRAPHDIQALVQMWNEGLAEERAVVLPTPPAPSASIERKPRRPTTDPVRAMVVRHMYGYLSRMPERLK